MKKIIFLLLISVNSYGQLEMKKPSKTIKIGEAKIVGSLIAKLEYVVIDEDTFCVLSYNNAEYSTLTDIQSIWFKDADSTLSKLYTTLKASFSDENKKNKEYRVEFTLGKQDVILTNKRTMGTTYTMFFTTDGYFYLTENQLEKLYGKSK